MPKKGTYCEPSQTQKYWFVTCIKAPVGRLTSLWNCTVTGPAKQCLAWAEDTRDYSPWGSRWRLDPRHIPCHFRTPGPPSEPDDWWCPEDWAYGQLPSWWRTLCRLDHILVSDSSLGSLSITIYRFNCSLKHLTCTQSTILNLRQQIWLWSSDFLFLLHPNKGSSTRRVIRMLDVNTEARVQIPTKTEDTL